MLRSAGARISPSLLRDPRPLIALLVTLLCGIPSVATGQGGLAVNVQAKQRLMTATYKVYGLGEDLGDQWVARAEFTNGGAKVISNLRVRFRLRGYSEWSSWEKRARLAPGETDVRTYYPVLDRSIAQIRSTTPSDVLVEWIYKTSDGTEHEDNASKRVHLLGANEFVFSSAQDSVSADFTSRMSNAPLLAAWVSRDDPVVKQFAAMANKMAGGVGASENDDNAERAMRACYEILVANDFTYQHPPELVTERASFDPQHVQNVKYPRDVILDRSGTCIDLAILYASMVNAIGLKPVLALVPGHCFPIVFLPSGKYMAVEVTGIGGGRGRHIPFEGAVRTGNAEVEKYVKKSKDHHLVDVRQLWGVGVANPELDPLPADILERKGIGPGQVPAAPAPSSDDDAPRPAAAADYAGSWAGTITFSGEGAQPVRVPFWLVVQEDGEGGYTALARFQISFTTKDGSTLTAQIDEVLTGTRGDNGLLVMRGRRKTLTNVATGQSVAGTLDAAVFKIGDGVLYGKFGPNQNTLADVVLERRS